MTQQATTASAPKNGGGKDQSAAPSANWWEQYANDEHVKIDIDLASFKPELFTKRDEKDPTKQVYTGLPLKGFPLAYMKFGEMEELDDNGRPKLDENGQPIVRDALGFVWLLTGPLKTMKNREVFDSKPGDRIIVWGNAQMAQGVRPDAANHPTKAIHMVVTPLFKGEHPTEKKKSMWRFEFAEGRVIDRASLPKVGGSMLQLVASAQKILSLPAANVPEAPPAPF